MNGQHENSHSADQHGRLQQVESHVLQRLGKGFLVLIPLLATLIIVSYSIGAFVDVLRPFIDGFTQVPFIASVPAVEMFTWIVFVGVVLGTFYFAGALVSAGSRRRVVQLQNAILCRIPVVKSIYGVVRRIRDGAALRVRSRVDQCVAGVLGGWRRRRPGPGTCHEGQRGRGGEMRRASVHSSAGAGRAGGMSDTAVVASRVRPRRPARGETAREQ